MMRGFALAIQVNQTDTTSDCVRHMDLLVNQYSAFFRSISNFFSYIYVPYDEQPLEVQEKGYNVLLLPILYYGSAFIELSDTLVACDYEQILQQWAFRLNSVAGTQDFIFVLVSASLGWLAHWNSFFDNSI